MMPKQKHQQPPDASPTMITHLKRDSCDSPDQPHAEEPPAKRQRGVPLNFSIESIMQPHLQQQHQQATDKSGRQQFESRSPTPSSSMSPVSTRHADHERSASSSPASLVSAGSVELKCDRLSPGASSISRASTPISPGCCDNPRKSAGLDRHNHHHHHDQHNSTSQTAAYMSNNNTKQPDSPIGNSHTQVATQHRSHHPHHQQASASTIFAQSANATQANLSSSAKLNQVECVLDNKDMWDKFHSLNTEMIITKTGRRMFPVLKVQFHNLDPNARYAVSMDIVPVDSKRYRYAYHKSCWQVAGKADPSAEPRLYPHPDSPFNGDLLSRQVISFEKVKLTNNEMDRSGHIILNSMHKYQPRVHLIELKSTLTGGVQQAAPTRSQQTPAGAAAGRYSHHQHSFQQQQQQQQQQKQPVPQLEIEGYRTYVFPETVFTAVTAYQNQLITKMKIDKNPFAKGFRDSSRLSDLDRNDPFDYMSSLGPAAACAAAAAAAQAAVAHGRGYPPGPATSQSAGLLPSPLDAMQPGAGPGSHLDAAYAQLLAAAQNPWYAAAAAAAAASNAAQPNPFGGPLPPPPSVPPSSAPSLLPPITPTYSAAGVPTSSASQQHHQQQQQQQQIQATQMWLAALACLNQQPGGGQNGTPLPPMLPGAGGAHNPLAMLGLSAAGAPPMRPPDLDEPRSPPM